MPGGCRRSRPDRGGLLPSLPPCRRHRCAGAWPRCSEPPWSRCCRCPQRRPAAGGRSGQNPPPAGAGTGYRPKTGVLQHPADDGGSKAGMVHVGVAGHHHDVRPVPAPVLHFLFRQRQKGIAILLMIFTIECGGRQLLRYRRLISPGNRRRRSDPALHRGAGSASYPEVRRGCSSASLPKPHRSGK